MIPWMWISIGKKKNNKLEETMLGPKPNSVSTNGSVQEKNNKNPTLEWLEHLYKIPPKRSKNVTSLYRFAPFSSVAWLFRQGFIRLHCPTPGDVSSVSSAMGTHRWDHDTHAMLKERNWGKNTHTQTLTSEIDVLTAWLDFIESMNLRIICQFAQHCVEGSCHKGHTHLCHLVSTSGKNNKHVMCMVDASYSSTPTEVARYYRLEYCQITAECISFRVTTVETKTLQYLHEGGWNKQ